jgi:hypothetical protein
MVRKDERAKSGGRHALTTRCPAGGSQTGDLASPVKVGNETIYYRGHRILRAMIPYLLANEGLAAATDIVRDKAWEIPAAPLHEPVPSR